MAVMIRSRRSSSAPLMRSRNRWGGDSRSASRDGGRGAPSYCGKPPRERSNFWFAVGKQLGLVLADLREPDRRVKVGHVDLEALVDDVVPPGAGHVLLERALVLPVEGQRLEEGVLLLVVERRGQVDRDRAALAGGD